MTAWIAADGRRAEARRPSSRRGRTAARRAAVDAARSTRGCDGTTAAAGVPFAVKDNIDVAGVPDHRRLPAVRVRARARRRPVGAAAARRRRGLRRQDQPRPVRHRAGRHAVAALRRRAATRSIPSYIAGGSSSGSAVAVAHRRGRRSRSAPTPRARVGCPAALLRHRRAEADARAGAARDGVVPALASFDCVSVFTRDGAPTRRRCSACSADRDRRRRSRGPTRARRADDLEWFGDDDAPRAVRRARSTSSRARVHRRRGRRGAVLERRRRCSTAARWWPSGTPRSARSPPRIPTPIDPTVAAIVAARRRVHRAPTCSARSRRSSPSSASDASPTLGGVDALLLPTIARVPTLDEVARRSVRPEPRSSGTLHRVRQPARPGRGRGAVRARARRACPFGVSLVGPGGRRRRAARARARGSPARRCPRRPTTSGTAAPAGGRRRAPHRPAAQPPAHRPRRACCARRRPRRPTYRLFALDTTPPKPGLLRAPGGAARAIEVEVWALDARRARRVRRRHPGAARRRQGRARRRHRGHRLPVRAARGGGRPGDHRVRRLARLPRGRLTPPPGPACDRAATRPRSDREPPSPGSK